MIYVLLLFTNNWNTDRNFPRIISQTQLVLYY